MVASLGQMPTVPICLKMLKLITVSYKFSKNIDICKWESVSTKILKKTKDNGASLICNISF